MSITKQQNTKQKITESEIIEIIKKKKHHHLRPNDSPEGIKTISGIISKFFLIAIVFFFIAFFCFEFFDIYPFASNVTEGFNSETSSIPEKYIVEPEPVNKLSYPVEGTETSSIFDSNIEKENVNIHITEPKNIDMGVIHSHRYYKSVENSPEAILAKQQSKNINQNPKMSIASLRQEIPSAYMISLLKQVNKQSFNIKKERLTENKLNYLDDLLDIIHQSKNINQHPPNTLIPFNILLGNVDKENQSRLNSLFQVCKIYLISLINIKLLELGQSHKAHPFQFLRIINSENLGLIKPASTNIKQVGLVVNIVAYRKLKTHGFNIQAVINCNLDSGRNGEDNISNNKITCNITSLELLGTPMQNDLPVNKLGMTKLLKGHHNVNKNGSPISKDGITGNIEETNNIPKEQIEKEWIAKNKLMNENIRTVRLNASTYGVEGSDDIDQKQKDQIAELSAAQGYSPQLYGSYKCFGVYPDGQSKTLNEIEDPITCQSYIPEIASVGVWDAPCKENAECPFYDASTGEGKCRPDDGKCEMPPGVTRIGYKKYSKYTDKM